MFNLNFDIVFACLLTLSCVSYARHWRAGKIVGMLLEGSPYKTLTMLCNTDSTVELNQLVDAAWPMLEIQRLELASRDVTREEGLLLLNPIVRNFLRFLSAGRTGKF